MKKYLFIGLMILAFMLSTGCEITKEQEPYVSQRKDKVVDTAFSNDEAEKEEETEVKKEEPVKPEPKPEVQEDKKTEYYKATDYLNLRSTPEEQGMVLGTIAVSDIVELVEKDANWALVKYGEIQGYVKTQWLSKVEIKTVSVFKTSLMSSADPNGYMIEEIFRNSTLEVMEATTEGGVKWYKVNYQGVEGYVIGSDVK